MGAVWCHPGCGVSPEERAAIIARLHAAGVDIGPDDDGATLVLFPHATASADAASALAKLVRERGGCVLAVAVGVDPEGGWTPWPLLAGGATDSVQWRDHESRPGALAARLGRWVEIDAIADSPAVQSRFVGAAPVWRAFLRRLIEAARYSSASVLLMGESGTGKELAAQAVHDLDPRPHKGSLVVVDCTTVVPDLSGSEFFGHERGAYTGAVGSRAGAFAIANGGTLFLDEVAELPLPLQAQLLRVIQERTYKAVGGNTWRRTDFRLVCATNRDLPTEVGAGRFRADLYFRLAACVIRVPPLRERLEDVVPLAEHFLRAAGVNAAFPPPIRQQLISRDYRGNVRELQQIVAEAARRHVGDGPITPGDLPVEARPTAGATGDVLADLVPAVARAVAGGATLSDIKRAAEEAAIRCAMGLSRSQRDACARLGVTPRSIQLRAKRGRGRVTGDQASA